MKPLPTILSTLVILGACGQLLQRSLPTLLEEPSTEGSQEVFEEKPTTSIVGEFRTSAASYLYGKAHEYMHGGVVFRAATEEEIAAGKRLATHGDSLEDHHGTRETSVVPEVEYDPRTFWGSLERGTQPWMDIRHHGHRDLIESLPLFRLMTWSDPHFIEGYDMGSYLVFSAAKDNNVGRAMAFLEEGLANNPNAWRLHKSYGHYALTLKKDTDLALRHLQRAVEILESKAAQPKKEQTARQNLIQDMEASQAWNEFIQALRKSGKREEAIRWSKRCIEVNAPCPSGRRTLTLYGIRDSPPPTR